MLFRSEIHLGRTQGPDAAHPFLTIESRPDGAMARGGRIAGTYVHGLFGGDIFRRAYLADFGVSATLAYEQEIEAVLDRLADHCERHLDCDAMLEIARSR